MLKSNIASAIKLKDGFVGLFFFFISLYLIKHFNFRRPLNASIFSLAVTALPMIIMSFVSSKVHMLPDYCFQFSNPHRIDFKRVLKKSLALYLIWTIFITLYLLIPEYQKEMYLPFGRLLYRIIPLMMIAAAPYFAICERYRKNDEETDAYLHLAQVITLNEKPQWQLLSQLILGWTVKAFFFPLMFTSLVAKMDTFILNGISFSLKPRFLYEFCYQLFFAIDVVFVTIGYAMTFKIFHSHIRSTERTLIGWVIALICYIPFWPILDRFYFHYYMEGPPWWFWLKNSFLEIPWVLMIIVCLGTYTFATISFGIRFSNLTNRGIITHGPYRWMKHPAYVSKCLAWLLISVPFITHPQAAHPFIRTSALIVLWGIYFVRAKTEERHLKSDPHYQFYCEGFKK
ncbi:MAG: hypothetical protein COW00_19015 [Bdellovibrio sp. CG12_big_fil_rev_8_21_14_0_65_39_13]|nr:MAG: hypothetical protein COW78_17260 [Bdellovibrio sp. CG22_combo_CG10-13_8_21_14_all_39_27]PIQ57788.1 MAG: hypothetical protein COW00_19015 [Bdellovibrio sp. CG12_big_fil_rev_8_21_14_0_65_39_13]PIR34662.1 MAG: hypothetical protein COV37_12065 [Bdellovibrio sp. CG11_big_fil_rev_8_21_14_0_20_39_38]